MLSGNPVSPICSSAISEGWVEKIIDQPDSFAFILESKQFSFTSAAAPRNSQLMLFPHSVRCQISRKTKSLIKICRVWVEQWIQKQSQQQCFWKMSAFVQVGKIGFFWKDVYRRGPVSVIVAWHLACIQQALKLLILWAFKRIHF